MPDENPLYSGREGFDLSLFSYNDASLPLYLVDEIMEIIQDEYDKSVRLDIYIFARESLS